MARIVIGADLVGFQGGCGRLVFRLYSNLGGERQAGWAAKASGGKGIVLVLVECRGPAVQIVTQGLGTRRGNI